MSEHDAIQSLAALGDVFASFASIYFSITFAYISVAYLVGRTMSRFQCLAVSFLYVVAAGIFGGSTVGYTDAWFTVKAQNKTTLDKVWIMQDVGWYPATWIMVVAVTALSLYFMYDVRKKKES